MGTFEDVAIASKTAWDAGDLQEAYRQLLSAREIVGDKGFVEQNPDGTLRIIPKG